MAAILKMWRQLENPMRIYLNIPANTYPMWNDAALGFSEDGRPIKTARRWIAILDQLWSKSN